MKLYLVQHGKALPEEIDPKKPLSQEGGEDVKRVGRFLKEKKISLDVIWYSEKLRAKQTAQILAEQILPKEGLTEVKGLAPLDSAEDMVKKITDENKDIMVISHLPFLQKFCSLILTPPQNYNLINFSCGGCICLEEKDKIFGISWIVTPELIK